MGGGGGLLCLDKNINKKSATKGDLSLVELVGQLFGASVGYRHPTFGPAGVCSATMVASDHLGVFHGKPEHSGG